MVQGVVAEVRWAPRSPAQTNVDVSSATGLTVPADTQAALIQAQDGAVRYRDDGTSPTNSTGVLMAEGASLFYTGDLTAIEFIEDGTSGATITVLYYGWSD